MPLDLDLFLAKKTYFRSLRVSDSVLTIHKAVIHHVVFGSSHIINLKKVVATQQPAGYLIERVG